MSGILWGRAGSCRRLIFLFFCRWVWVITYYRIISSMDGLVYLIFWCVCWDWIIGIFGSDQGSLRWFRWKTPYSRIFLFSVLHLGSTSGSWYWGLRYHFLMGVQSTSEPVLAGWSSRSQGTLVCLWPSLPAGSRRPKYRFPWSSMPSWGGFLVLGTSVWQCTR
jgi:hypothetical protein